MTRFTFTLLTAIILAAPVSVRANDLIEVFTEPYQVIDLAAAEAGILEKIHVKQGEFVEAGDLVANLNREVLLASLEVARMRANLRATQQKALADAAQRRRRYNKIASLHASGHASEEELDSAKSAMEIAEAGVLEATENQQLAKLEVRRIQSQLRRREIRSPISGQIVRIDKDPGEYVASIEPVVARIVQLDRLRVKFFVTTSVAKTILPGARIPLQLIESGQRVEGLVEFVAPTTDADSGTVRIEVIIENPRGRYRAGVGVRIDDHDQARNWLYDELRRRSRFQSNQ